MAFLAGMLTQTQTVNEVRLYVTSFAGGAVAFVAIWGGFGKQIFDNLERVADSRGERIEELERHLEEERKERKSAMAAQEQRHQAEIDKLTNQIKVLETQYQAAIAEKTALMVELTKRQPG